MSFYQQVSKLNMNQHLPQKDSSSSVLGLNSHMVPFSFKGVPLNDVFVPRETEMQRLEQFCFSPERVP